MHLHSKVCIFILIRSLLHANLVYPFTEFADEIEVMRSLAKPRKITIRGSNGQIYMFLGKPKDDLRKDARLMDFNAIINKLLKANMESRRRRLCKTFSLICFVRTQIMCRHSYIRRCDTERRMWLHSMGSRYHSGSTCLNQSIRGSKYQDLGEFLHFTSSLLSQLFLV
jgi:hypothetical protein